MSEQLEDIDDLAEKGEWSHKYEAIPSSLLSSSSPPPSTLFKNGEGGGEKEKEEQGGGEKNDELGRGAFAEVKMIRNKHTHLIYACKTLHRRRLLLEHPIALQQVAMEVSILKKIKSKNVVKIRDVYADDTYVSIVMSCADGSLASLMNMSSVKTATSHSVDSWFSSEYGSVKEGEEEEGGKDKGGSMSMRHVHKDDAYLHSSPVITELEGNESVCKVIAKGVIEGIADIHEAGYVHRDIKPENILLFNRDLIHLRDGQGGQVGIGGVHKNGEGRGGRGEGKEGKKGGRGEKERYDDDDDDMRRGGIGRVSLPFPSPSQYMRASNRSCAVPFDVVIADFGLALPLPKSGGVSKVGGAASKKGGGGGIRLHGVCGSPLCMAPEVAWEKVGEKEGGAHYESEEVRKRRERRRRMSALMSCLQKKWTNWMRR
uniref:Protein kinase domain-containing protein n=1 Tax=Palpitomonas bilix TaxID=652834 RepID=A0A7S3GF07_9EUKA|mmetsp:Transcript_46472/g.119930  ORF Transcript_46472/g.119930 Transcript_46472/m.119930 type:complete len:429 (+) Transcript_46472:95-1381(+)